MSKLNLSKIIYYLLNIILIIGIISIPFISIIYNIIGAENMLNFNKQTLIYQIALYICYIISLGIIFVLILLFKNIYKYNPFTIYTEKYLKIISLMFMILSIIIFIKTLFILTIISLSIGVITFIVSLCFYTLSEIFKEANINKKELDSVI